MGRKGGPQQIDGTSGIITDSSFPFTSPFPHCLSPPVNSEALLCPLLRKMTGERGLVVAAGGREKGVCLCLVYHKGLALRETGRAG